MTYIPKMALELQPFSSVKELNHHMNLHFLSFKDTLRKSNDIIFHLIKKYACRVAGVCWLRQESLANLAQVSVKTVERAMKLLKEIGVIKIYHTNRSNGLNGNCYYVLQPFQGDLEMDDEEIVSVEEGNVGAIECLETYETTKPEDVQTKDKLFISSFKAFENSLNTKKEEEIINNARVQSNIMNLKNIKHPAPTKTFTQEEYKAVVNFLVENQFAEDAALEITNQVIQTCPAIKPFKVIRAYAKAWFKFNKRSAYHQPIFSVVDYFVRLVVEELQPSFASGRTTNPQLNTSSNPETTRNPEALELFEYFRDYVMGYEKSGICEFF
jgi:hypothetical protein